MQSRGQPTLPAGIQQTDLPFYKKTKKKRGKSKYEVSKLSSLRFSAPGLFHTVIRN